jgi:hypothetical protein
MGVKLRQRLWANWGAVEGRTWVLFGPVGTMVV